MKHRQLLALLLALFFVSVSSAAAFDTFVVGPRALGMAGANVVSVNDTTAQYYNPAAFGFFAKRDKDGKKLAADNTDIGHKVWGVDLNAAAGYQIHNDFGQYLDDLVNLDQVTLGENGVQNESDLQNLIDIFNNLNGLDQPGNAVTSDATAGFGFRLWNFGLGVRGFAQATGQVVDLDTVNLGLNGGDLDTQVATIDPAGNDSETLLFSADQQAQLAAAGLSADTIQKLDFTARQNSIPASQVQALVDLLENAALQSGTTNSLDLNTTTVALRGFAVAEIPLSFGYAINDNWSVGANLKIMQGRVYGTEILVFDTDGDKLLDSVDQHYKDTTAFGIDVGVMGRYKYVGFGLVGRNLNSPSFDGLTVQTDLPDGSTRTTRFPDVTLNPQVTAGVALIPLETLVFETNIDLTRNESALPGYETQKLSFGAEWDAFRAVAIRAGAYRNLAENDIGWVATAGLGVNLWAARLDIAGAMALGHEQFDNNDVPKEARVSAALSVDF